jgi:RNA polymerase primary sigma factor
LYLYAISTVKLLTPHAEGALVNRTKKGDKEAREKLIKANLGLVVEIARVHEGLGLPLLDLVSEGNLGLIEAVDRFDRARAGKLATSASWWIKRSITRALANQSQTITDSHRDIEPIKPLPAWRSQPSAVGLWLR